MRQPSRKVTRFQAAAIVRLLGEHCAKDEATGFAIYERGWDDGEIAERVSTPEHPVGRASVAAWRMDTIGKVRPARTRKLNGGGGLEDRVDRLEAAMSELTAALERVFPKMGVRVYSPRGRSTSKTAADVRQMTLGTEQ